jgi:hypothetical protein
MAIGGDDEVCGMSFPRSAMLASWRPLLTLSVPLLPLAFAA